jgi:hypothetical protein
LLARDAPLAYPRDLRRLEAVLLDVVAKNPGLAVVELFQGEKKHLDGISKAEVVMVDTRLASDK